MYFPLRIAFEKKQEKEIEFLFYMKEKPFIF